MADEVVKVTVEEDKGPLGDQAQFTEYVNQIQDEEDPDKRFGIASDMYQLFYKAYSDAADLSETIASNNQKIAELKKDLRAQMLKNIPMNAKGTKPKADKNPYAELLGGYN